MNDYGVIREEPPAAEDLEAKPKRNCYPCRVILTARFCTGSAAPSQTV